MSEEREMIVEQRNLLLSNLALFYPSARAGESYFMMMPTAFPEYTRRYCLRDLAYLEAKGYLEKLGPRGEKCPLGTPWNEARWKLTASGFEIAQRILEDPALEV